MDLGQVLPWGLTLGQSLCIGIGGVMLLGGWTIVSSMFKLGKNMLMCGLVLTLMLMCFGSILFAIYQLDR